MKKIKLYIQKYGFLVLILTLIVVVANVCKKTSAVTLTKYRTSVNGTDSTRVAKWSLSQNSILAGQQIALDSGFRTEILNGTGNWAFQISNDSEVNATVDLSSSIRVRLDNDAFNRGSSDKMNWNFLKSESGNIIDNPITFVIKVYNASISELLKYQNDQGSVISYDQYMKKTPEEKENYTQVVDENVASTKINVSLLELNKTKNLEFTKSNENVNSKLVFFYYLDIKFEDIVNEITENQTDIKNKLFGLPMEEDKNITFIINWEVSTTSTTTGGANYGEYYGYELHETQPTNGTSTAVTIDGITYYFYKTNQKNFFDYQKYIASLNGGEPRFEFLLNNGVYSKIKYSDLTTNQKQEIENYRDVDPSNPDSTVTYSDLKHYVEKLQYKEYKRFLKDNEEQQVALGYLSYGLKVNIQFNIKIGQVKPE